MKCRFGAALFGLLLFTCSGPLVFGQSYAQYGSGESTLRGSFDPSAPGFPPRIPQTGGVPIAVPRLPVIPTSEYEQRKAVPPRAPNGLTPGITWSSPSGDPVNVPARLPLQTTPTLSFEGIQQTLYHPPSPDIAAGPDDLLQVVNSSIARYTRTGQLTSQTDLTQWFGSLFSTICPSGANCILGDVSIHYDQMHGRFVLTLQAFDQGSAASHLLVSVSKGATYASGWTNWALNERLDGSTTTTNWADFIQTGMDQSAIYVTSNQFSFSTFLFQYAKVRIIRKSDLYSAATVTLPYQDIFNLKNEDGTTASTLQVPHLRGRTQIGTSTGIMINASDMVNATYYTLWRINNPTSNNPTATRVTMGGVRPYTYPAAAPQLGSVVMLDTGPSSFFQPIMRDGLVFAAQNVGNPDEPTTVTYNIIDVLQNKVTLQQRWVNGTYFYSAFDVPASVGPGNTLPNNLFVGTTTSPTGARTYAGVTNLKEGEDAYDVFASGSTTRWGDYFGASVDPINGGLWVSGEYAKPRVGISPRWGTWNAYVPWSTGQEFADVPSTSQQFDFINIMKLWNVTKGCSTTPSLYCPTAPVTRGQLGVFIIRSIYGDTFPYPTVPYFEDVPATDPNFSYLQKMRELGITKGCSVSPSRYCPDQTATREMASAFIIRGKLGPLFGDEFSYPPTPYFSDVPATHANFRFIQKMRELGMTNGCAVGPPAYCPEAELTREQVAAFIVRAFWN